MTTSTLQAPVRTITIEAPRLVFSTPAKTSRFANLSKVQVIFLALAALSVAIVWVSMGMDVLFNDQLAMSTTPFIFRDIMKAALVPLVTSVAVLTASYIRDKKA